MILDITSRPWLLDSSVLLIIVLIGFKHDIFLGILASIHEYSCIHVFNKCDSANVQMEFYSGRQIHGSWWRRGCTIIVNSKRCMSSLKNLFYVNMSIWGSRLWKHGKKQAFCCSIFANVAFRIEKIFQFLKRMIIAE